MDTWTTTVFKALAHPARREIVAMLSMSDHTVKELTNSFDMSQPAISQHLRELRDAKLVAARRVGTEQQYRLTGQPLKVVFDWCVQYRRFFDPAGHAWAFNATEAAMPKREIKGGRKNGG